MFICFKNRHQFTIRDYNTRLIFVSSSYLKYSNSPIE
nr:MAG TPA: protein of unknown function (DUF1508) [Caudoviricetes sp.]